MIKKAQATLEFTLIFVILVSLLAGLLSLWKGSSDAIIKRQMDYNLNRKTVGSIPSGVSFSNTTATGAVINNTQSTLDALTIAINNTLSLLDTLNAVGDFSSLSLDDINNLLNNANNLISNLQANISALVDASNTWKSNLEYDQGQEAAIQQRIIDLQRQLASTTNQGVRSVLNEELAQAQNELLGWQAKVADDQQQYDQIQSALSSANSTLSQITAIRDQLQAAKDSKSQP